MLLHKFWNYLGMVLVLEGDNPWRFVRFPFPFSTCFLVGEDPILGDPVNKIGPYLNFLSSWTILSELNYGSDIELKEFWCFPDDISIYDYLLL